MKVVRRIMKCKQCGFLKDLIRERILSVVKSLRTYMLKLPEGAVLNLNV